MSQQKTALPRTRVQRRFPRLEVDGVLRVEDQTLGKRIEVRDIGDGGFRTLSPIALRVGVLHLFCFPLPNRRWCKLIARVTHCQPLVESRPPFWIGWEVTNRAESQASLAAVMESLTTVMPAADAPPRR